MDDLVRARSATPRCAVASSNAGRWRGPRASDPSAAWSAVEPPRAGWRARAARASRLLFVVALAGCTVGAGSVDDAGAPSGDAAVQDAAAVVPDASLACPRCDGAAWIACDGTRTVCDGVCAPDLGCRACVPGRRFCASPSEARLCDDVGEDSTPVATCAPDEVCQSGVCARACAADADTDNPTTGCDFVAVPTLNSQLGSQWRAFMDFVTLGATGFHFAVTLANPQPYEVTARITGNGVDLEQTIGAGEVRAVELPFVPLVTQTYPAGIPTEGPYGPWRGSPSVHATDASYRIRTNAPVVAYQFNPLASYDDDPTHATCATGGNQSCFSYTNDASLLLPVHALGRRYTAVAYGTGYQTETCGPLFGVADRPGGYVAVVAVHAEPTEVTVVPSAPVRAGPDHDRLEVGVAVTRTLAAGDVWELIADHPTDEECVPLPGPACGVTCSFGSDLTGTVVTATRGVAVFAGHDCAQVPVGVDACDHLEDQLWPDEALGSRYVLLPAYAPEGASRTLTVGRVVATAAGTQVEIAPRASGVDGATLGAGETLELELLGPVEVSASAPVAAAQFLVGDALSERSSDPSMVVAVPVEQWRTDYAISVPETYPESWLTVAAPIGTPVSLDGELITPFERTASYEISYARVSPGPHRLDGASPFTVLVSGHGPYVSYAYPGGGNVRFLH